MQVFALADPVAKQSMDTGIVFVVDDDPSVRESLEGMLRSVGERVETFATANEFLDRSRSREPSCLVLDVGLPDLNGLDLQERVAQDRADMPIIFISGYGDIPMTVRAMRAGAVEFLTKPLSQESFLGTVRSALRRSAALLEQHATSARLRNRYASLSPREREVMALVTTGLMNKQVGGKLHISEVTVKAHRGSVMRKMGARSLADLVTMAASLRHPQSDDESLLSSSS